MDKTIPTHAERLHEISSELKIIADKLLLTPVAGELSRFNHVPIMALGLSSRAQNCLLRYGIKHVGQLIELSLAELMRIPNMGFVSIKEIDSRIKDLGLSGWR